MSFLDLARQGLYLKSPYSGQHRVQLFRQSKYRIGLSCLKLAVTKSSSVHVMGDIIRHKISIFSNFMGNESKNLSSVLNFSWYRISEEALFCYCCCNKKHCQKSATKKKGKKTISLSSIIGSILCVFAVKALSQLSVFLVKCCEIN